MAKFWQSSSSSGSDSEAGSDGESRRSSSSSSSSSVAQTRQRRQSVSSTDSDGSVQRQAGFKEPQEKFEDQLRQVVLKALHQQNNSLFPELEVSYANILKMMGSNECVSGHVHIPNFVYRYLADLNSFLAGMTKTHAKSLSQARAVALNRLKAKTKKSLEEHQELIDEAAANPEKFQHVMEYFADKGSDDEESDMAESDEDENEKKPVKQAKPMRAESDGSGSAWSQMETSSSSSSSESEEEATTTMTYEERHARALRKWGISADTTKIETAKKTRGVAKPARDEAAKRAAAAAGGSGGAAIEGGAFHMSKLTEQELAGDIEPAKLQRYIEELLDNFAQSKRGMVRPASFKLLLELTHIGKKVMPSAVIMEYLPSILTGVLDSWTERNTPITAASWTIAADHVHFMMTTFAQSPDVSFSPTRHASGAVNLPDLTSGDLSDSQGQLAFVVSVSNRLDDVIQKSMANQLEEGPVPGKDAIDHELLMPSLVALLWRTVCFSLTAKIQDSSDESATQVRSATVRSAMKLLERCYWMTEKQAQTLWADVQTLLQAFPVPRCMVPFPLDASTSSATPGGKSSVPFEAVSYLEFIEQMSNYIFANCGAEFNRARIRALLCSIYSLVLQGDFRRAFAMFKSTSLLQAVQGNTQVEILYNRTVAQLGICAFRSGFFTNAYYLLTDLCNLNRQRELLAQGLPAYKMADRTADQEMAERRKLLPDYMHINLDLLECVFALSSLMVELPQMMYDQDTSRRPVISRLKRSIENFEKSFNPTVNIKEMILVTAKSIQQGDWEQAEEIIKAMKFWSLISDDPVTLETIQANLFKKVREVSLWCWVATSAHSFHSISVQQLSDLFGTEPEIVRSYLSNLIYKGFLPAKLDILADTLLFNHTSATVVDSLSFKCADKLANVVEANENLLISAGVPLQPGQSRAKKTNKRLAAFI